MTRPRFLCSRTQQGRIMNKLGTEKKPAIARVRTPERAEEILEICEERGWKVIVGVEPDKREDISDINKLLNPPQPMVVGKSAPKLKHSKNGPCPCGSGMKYKKCCMQKDLDSDSLS